MTYHLPRPGATALIRSQEPRDLAECGMVVRLGAQLLDVHDLSIGGLRVPRCALAPGTQVTLQLIPREGRKLVLPQAVAAKGEVVGQCASWTRLQFIGMSFSLAKFLIRHIASRHGVEPYIFK